MGKRRKLDASLPPELNTADIPDDLDTKSMNGAGQGGTMGGFWGNSAMNMLKTKLEETQASISAAIMEGVIAIEISPDMIVDEVGTDRLGDWAQDGEFKALVADIKRRGQKQAIRVRPADPEWQPDSNNPYVGQGRLIVQSGRRRMAVAKALGIPVRAIISTDIGDASLADLEERFLENTMRKDLTGFEQLLSIGMLAGRYGDLSQTEIAERLQVRQGDVSLGLSCVEYYDEIVKNVDIQTAPKRAYREILPKLKKGEIGALKPASAQASGNKMIHRAGDVTVELKPSKKGFALSVEGYKGGREDLHRIAEEFAARLSKLAR